jgi:heme oxygenase
MAVAPRSKIVRGTYIRDQLTSDTEEEVATNHVVTAAAAAPLPPGAIAALRSATWPSHQRLEKRLDVKARFSNIGAYREHLEKMWGFCAALERQVAPGALADALPDYPSRRKLPFLTRDLLALGKDSDSIAKLAHCVGLPACPDTARAFGCVYVLEGATLGGRTLLPLVESRLGITAQTGASFLASYGENVPSMWRAFGAALDAWCIGPEQTAAAARAAVDTFDALEIWLCGAPS